jgi:hypothetical protein
MDMTIEAMKQALEALEGLSEPYYVLKAQDALRAAIEAAEKQEPVGEVLNERGEVDYISHVPPAGTPLYTTPPAAQRQPLTDDEIDDIWNRYCDEMGEASINDAYDIARAIERAHGIGGEA